MGHSPPVGIGRCHSFHFIGNGSFELITQWISRTRAIEGHKKTVDSGIRPGSIPGHEFVAEVAEVGEGVSGWSDGWWEFTKFSVEEHQRLGMQAWFDDWTAHGFFQNKLRAESEEKTALTGQRLVIREEESSAPGTIQMEIPQEEEILHAAAYKKVGGGSASICKGSVESYDCDSTGNSYRPVTFSSLCVTWLS